MMMRAALRRGIGLWIATWLLAAFVGATSVRAHDGHHHAPDRAVEPVRHATAPIAVVMIAAARVADCQPDHGAADHGLCCGGVSCCTAGCGAAALAVEPAGLFHRPRAGSPPGAGSARPGRDTRPAEHPPRPTA